MAVQTSGGVSGEKEGGGMSLLTWTRVLITRITPSHLESGSPGRAPTELGADFCLLLVPRVQCGFRPLFDKPPLATCIVKVFESLFLIRYRRLNEAI